MRKEGTLTTLNGNFIISQTLLSQPGPPDEGTGFGERMSFSLKCLRGGFDFLMKGCMKIPSSNNLLNYI